MFAGFARTQDGWQWCADRRGEFDFGDFFGVFGGGRPRGGPGGHGGRRGRMFEQGDLRLVVLRLLAEKPRHGYEIIKALEEQSGGMYAPSPGAVYPTLQLLEELGYARSVDEGNGRKMYEITDEGRAHLAEHRSAADDVFDRVRNVAGAGAEMFGELASAFGSLGRAAFRTASRSRGDHVKLNALREIIERAEHDIEKLG
ncbi:MAG: PadR family transcriptional regulator [Gemmatirosa sp.]|nr:PadR family transcriptional regulator [Gemmatirosa sp.]